MKHNSVKLIEDIRAARLTYCAAPKLENIATAIERIIYDEVAGDFIEAGVALGGSAILLGLLKPENATLHLYDVFGMIPPPGDQDGADAHRRYEVIRSGASPGLGSDRYYGYTKSLQEKVVSNLNSWGLSCRNNQIEIHPGLFQDTLRPAGPVALAHIDCDWYDSVNVCITRILPVLARGGIIIFDDYESYSGCTKAVNQLRDSRPDLQVLFHRRSIGFRLP